MSDAKARAAVLCLTDHIHAPVLGGAPDHLTDADVVAVWAEGGASGARTAMKLTQRIDIAAGRPGEMEASEARVEVARMCRCFCAGGSFGKPTRWRRAAHLTKGKGG